MKKYEFGFKTRRHGLHGEAQRLLRESLCLRGSKNNSPNKILRSINEERFEFFLVVKDGVA